MREQGELPRVKAIYLVPYFDNPCGITMPLERRARIVEIAKRWSDGQQIHVIADEAYRDLRYEATMFPARWPSTRRGTRSLSTGTFSKSFSPGIRVGWGVLPRHLIAPVCSQKGNIDFGSPNFSQHLMAEILTRGLFEPHLARIQQSYRQKLQAMLAALQQQFGSFPGVRWVRPGGGLYVWVQLPAEIATGPDGTLFDTAVREGVLYVPGEYCYPTSGEPIRPNTMRLSFGVQTPEKIAQGVAALARAVRQRLSSRGVTSRPGPRAIRDEPSGNGIPP